MRTEIECVVIIKGNVEEPFWKYTSKEVHRNCPKTLGLDEGLAAPTSNMSFKMHVVHSHINTYPENLCVISDEPGEQFHQKDDIKVDGINTCSF